uniref:Uncharacterized protein n=1 Tax=Oryza sativa subsp. japonica TaxID=39947 RepID=Q6ZC01_ORYSJ|nr:hypothetical protein [Oryza sativa Japonica Group]
MVRPHHYSSPVIVKLSLHIGAQSTISREGMGGYTRRWHRRRWEGEEDQKQLNARWGRKRMGRGGSVDKQGNRGLRRNRGTSSAPPFAIVDGRVNFCRARHTVRDAWSRARFTRTCGGARRNARGGYTVG